MPATILSCRPRQWLRVGLALCCGVWLPGALAGVMGVMQAYQAALLNDPLYRSALAEREAGQEFQHLGRAQLLPTVSAVYATSRNLADVTDARGTSESRHYTSVNGSLQLRQPLIHLEGRAAYRQGLARTAGSEALFSARRQELIVRLFDTYAAALYTQEELRLAQAQLDALDEQLRANEQLLAKGEGTRTDVLETRAKRAIAQAQLIEAQDNQQHARNRLAAMTGTPVDRLGRLVDEFDGARTQTPSLEEWRALALQNNGLLLSLAREVEAAREEINRVNSGHYPRLDLLASTGRSESDTVTTYRQTSRTTSLGVQLNVPLYAGGAVSSQTRQATARLAQAQAELDAKTSETLVDLHKQFHLQQSSGLRIQALLKAVEAGRVLIEATQKSVRGGERTNLDVLTARERLSASERDLLKARHTYLLAGLRLRSQAGVLEESDLGRVANLFEASS